MTTREPAGRQPNERNDWSLLGFLDKQLDSQERTERLKDLCRLFLPLATLIVVLAGLGLAAVVLALGHVNVIEGYYHLTRNASELQRWGIPSGAISVVIGGSKLSRAYRRRRQVTSPTRKTAGKRASKATASGRKKPLPQHGKAIEAKPDKAADEGNDPVGEPGGS